MSDNYIKDDNVLTVSVDQMRRSDAYTIEHLVPGKELMYRAAYGVYESYDGWQGKKIAIIVGGGNNGGDGYALAGILKKEGIDSEIFRVSDRLTEDGGYYCSIAKELGVPIRDFTAAAYDSGNGNTDSGDGFMISAAGDGNNSATDLSGYDVIVDCILGTGFQGEVRGKAADAIREINRCRGASDGNDIDRKGSDKYPFIISVDINSGMNGDTGEASLAVRSDLTVSIGYYKQGLFKGDADKYIGSLTNVDIGIVLI